MDRDLFSLLARYRAIAIETDGMPRTELNGVLMGLYGEVGSVMAASKKLRREGDVYSGYYNVCVEEFGDALWYLSAVCHRLDKKLEDVFASIIDASHRIESSELPDGLVVSTAEPLLSLGEAAATLFSISAVGKNVDDELRRFVAAYVSALDAAGLGLEKVIDENTKKVQGRFLKPDPTALPTFDQGYPEDEQLPEYFEIDFCQRYGGKSHIRWNGVFIGDPLTDNIVDEDGYRFHDVFHFANAAILHWSPTFRSLIKHKRKSDPKVDEAQDGGRAIVIEEGLAAWVFSYAKEMNFFADMGSLSFDLLKTIEQFVAGYEVQECPLSLWEEAILQGYSVFRQVLKNGGGTVIGERKTRSIIYRS